MFKSLKTTIATGLITAILALPSLVFGATAIVNIKDHVGNPYPNPQAVQLVIEDGFGSVIHNSPMTSASETIQNLAPYNNYTISVTKDTTIDGKLVKTLSRKSLSFANDNEVINKDIYIPNPVASNVLIRMSGMPADWTSGTLVLTPVQTSNVRHLYQNIEIPFTNTNGSFETTMTSLPAGTFKWSAQHTNPNQTVNGVQNVHARTNGTIMINTGSVTDQVIDVNFNLKNADRSNATFSGEQLNVVIKNPDTQAVVWQGSATPVSGSTHTISTPALAQGSYALAATMSKDGVTKHYSRNVFLGNSPKAVNLNPVKITFNEMTFKIKDSRTGANIPSGIVTIKRTVNNQTSVISTDNFSGGTITKSLANGVTYSVEVEANGYHKRTMSITPREDATREINLSSAM